MGIFSYTAINPEGKAMRGTVDAASKEAARTALEDLRYTVQSVEEASRASHALQSPSAPVHMGGTAFVFEGKDPQGVLKKGTVHTTSKREAFLKLTAEQGLLLSRLSPLGTPPSTFDPELAEWNSESRAPQLKEEKASLQPRKYHPLVSTLRLYAAWLLAWYGLFIAIGYYVSARVLPWDIPFVSAFSGSSLVFTFVSAIFFFLLLSTLHRALKGSTLMGAVFSLLWILIILAVRTVQI